MEKLRKITVQVPESDLEKAQALTGEGVTETVRAGLRRLAALKAQQELRSLRGAYRFRMNLADLRDDD